MTSSLLIPLLSANLAACVAIAVVLSLRAPARALLGAKAAYGLWLIVPAAMLATLAPARTVLIAPAAVSAPLAYSADLAQAMDVVAGPMTTPAAVTVLPSLDLAQTLLIIWLAGMAAGLILLAIGQRRALARFGTITADQGDLRLSRASNAGIGPALLGIVRPRVIVPADFETQFDIREREMILAHEGVHLASGHTLINALVAAVRIVNWFNPLIYVAARYARIDQELACDATVVERFPDARRSYAEALLKTQLGVVPLPLGCSWPARSQNLLEERIAMLSKARPGRLRLTAGLAGITALTLGAGLAAWSAEPPVMKIAQGPVSAQGAVGAALGVPAQAKVAAPPAAPTVKPGEGGGQPAAPKDPAALADAISRGDIRGALEQGASARQIALMTKAANPNAAVNPDTAVFVRAPSGAFALGYENRFVPALRAYGSPATFAGYVPPGGIDKLPTLEEAIPERPPLPNDVLAPAMGAVGRVYQAGGTAQEAVAAYFAVTGPVDTWGAPFDVDASAARFVRLPDPNGGVGLTIVGKDGKIAGIIRPIGSESYTGIANLPTQAEVVTAAPK